MRRIALILALITITSVSILGQKVAGSFSNLKNETRVRLVVDFSQGDIMGMSEDQFSIYEEDWIKDKPVLVSAVYNNANSVLNNKLALGNYQYETDYMITLFVRRVDGRGNYDCDVVLFTNGEPVGSAIGLRAKGGRFGSKLNLMKDGAENIGKNLGRLLKKEINRK